MQIQLARVENDVYMVPRGGWITGLAARALGYAIARYDTEAGWLVRTGPGPDGQGDQWVSAATKTIPASVLDALPKLSTDPQQCISDAMAQMRRQGPR
jgi:hypothetical protein